MRIFRASVVMVTLVVVAHPAVAGAFTTERVSVRSNGAQANDSSFSIDLSSGGRYVAFASNASNLVGTDTNGRLDVFVHDRLTGRTRLASVRSNGAQSTGSSGEYALAISAKGRYVVFDSDATDLVVNDTNASSDIFVHDMVTGSTRRVSVRSNGDQGDGDSIDSADISADGRFVAFNSLATNLVSGDTNLVSDVFVHDSTTGRTRRVSVRSDGAQGDGDSGLKAVAISADGLVVAFDSVATDLITIDSNGYGDIFVHDRVSGRTHRASVRSNGAQGDGPSQENVDLSGRGRLVAFSSDATNLVRGDTNAVMDVFVRDRGTGKTRRVSIRSNGDQGDGASASGSGGSFVMAMSASGRFVAFSSDATTLVPGDTNTLRDVFVHDSTTGRTRRVSVRSNGAQGNAASGYFGVGMSSDGRFVGYSSDASNLVRGGDTNGYADVFVSGPLP